MKVRVVIVGRGYSDGSVYPESLALPEDATVEHALIELAALLPVESALSATCLVAVSGRHVGTIGRHDNTSLRDGDELVVLAPVAGG